jgi:hypothetical protein
MKQKIKILFAVALLLSSIFSVVYACTPTFSHVGDEFQGCPGLFKRSKWNVIVSQGSQGQVTVPITTSGNGACGFENGCVGSGNWASCWPTFFHPETSSGCWRQRVQDNGVGCTSTACPPGSTNGAQQTCLCNPGLIHIFSVGSGGASCGGC